MHGSTTQKKIEKPPTSDKMEIVSQLKNIINKRCQDSRQIGLHHIHQRTFFQSWKIHIKAASKLRGSKFYSSSNSCLLDKVSLTKHTLHLVPIPHATGSSNFLGLSFFFPRPPGALVGSSSVFWVVLVGQPEVESCHGHDKGCDSASQGKGG